MLPHSNARWTNLIPGSLFYAIGTFVGQTLNILILDSMLESKSRTYGALGIAATLLLCFFFVGRVIVGAAVLNATLYDRRTRPAGVTLAGLVGRRLPAGLHRRRGLVATRAKHGGDCDLA